MRLELVTSIRAVGAPEGLLQPALILRARTRSARDEARGRMGEDAAGTPFYGSLPLGGSPFDSKAAEDAGGCGDEAHTVDSCGRDNSDDDLFAVPTIADGGKNYDYVLDNRAERGLDKGDLILSRRT